MKKVTLTKKNKRYQSNLQENGQPRQVEISTTISFNPKVIRSLYTKF